MSKIMLHSGQIFNILNPNLQQIKIEDIAHGLAHTCRFAGQCGHFYSVAEHSVNVSFVIPSLEALLHDASEAFLGDVVSPLKQLLPNYRQLEDEVMKTIYDQFGLRLPLTAAIKQADLSVMKTEIKCLMPHNRNGVYSLEHILPANIEIRCLSPQRAKSIFLNRFWELAI